MSDLKLQDNFLDALEALAKVHGLNIRLPRMRNSVLVVKSIRCDQEMEGFGQALQYITVELQQWVSDDTIDGTGREMGHRELGA